MNLQYLFNTKSSTPYIEIFLFQGKLQKHQAFEAEISAHSNAIVELQENGEGMINESHYASELIRVSSTVVLNHYM